VETGKFGADDLERLPARGTRQTGLLAVPENVLSNRLDLPAVVTTYFHQNLSPPLLLRSRDEILQRWKSLSRREDAPIPAEPTVLDTHIYHNSSKGYSGSELGLPATARNSCWAFKGRRESGKAQQERLDEMLNALKTEGTLIRQTLLHEVCFLSLPVP